MGKLTTVAEQELDSVPSVTATEDSSALHLCDIYFRGNSTRILMGGRCSLSSEVRENGMGKEVMYEQEEKYMG